MCAVHKAGAINTVIIAANPLGCGLRNRLLSLAPPGVSKNTSSKAAAYDAFAALHADTA